MPEFPAGQTLLFDADDTLWENNIYFERAIANFISFLDHQTHSPAEVRHILNECEHQTITIRGYGLKSFALSLENCYRRLSAHPVTDRHVARIHSFAQSVAQQDIELCRGVAETIPALAQRHRLILMTKGDVMEQTGKLERSGLAPHFSAVEVVSEKDLPTYQTVIARHSLDRAASWMIGNSPKSDINPSLAAGLNAVFLFHKDTWVLEHAEVNEAPPGQRLIKMEGFAKLGQLF